ELALIVEWGGFAAGSCAACFSVGASLLAKAARRSTRFYRIHAIQPMGCRRLRSFDLHAVSAKPPAPKPQNADTKTPGITRAFCIDLINERGK
ncbi:MULTISPECIES: hypothetical protein, partial [unclassified Pseudomonas]|uniref:hypothetical protein n=1 Tax=unclassified Pseudomonas TaxID=196821 RepID=UPI0019D5DCF3